MSPKSKLDLQLADDMALFYADPLGFVMYAYEWGTDPALCLVEMSEPWRSKYGSKYGPDAWACELFDSVGKDVKARSFDGRNPVAPIRKAVASGHGISKSATTAMLVSWILSTRPFSKGIITAGTFPQLQTKTFAEISKWMSRCITSHWFEVSANGLWVRNKENPDTWRCDGQTCKEENSESFAGLHAANSTPFYVMDESSAVPDKIWEVAEGGTTDGEPMWFAFGNPTRNSGRFKELFTGKYRSQWDTKQIDSRECYLPNKDLINEWIEIHGIDSDFVKVRVRGMFPNISIKQFISTDDVDKAFGKKLRFESYDFAPKILTCDPAWEGDDELVIGLRQGLAFKIIRTLAKNDNDIWVASLLANIEDQEEADAVFIDAGYGTGIVSAGKTLGRSWRLVWFSEESKDKGCLNKRAEMWKLMRDWLKEGGAIPEDHVLYNDLISPETVPRMDGKIQLESKADMKKRKIASPNRADALALSFAHPVLCRRHPVDIKGPGGEAVPFRQRVFTHTVDDSGGLFWRDRR